MTRILSLALLVVSFTAFAAGDKAVVHTFTKQEFSKQFWGEGAAAGDLNRDGKMDVIFGPYWYAGPDFTERHEYRPATNTFKLKKADGALETIPGFEGGLGVNNAYSDCFLMYTYDFNGDRWPDIFVIGFPGQAAYWCENPKKAGGFWKRHEVLAVVDNESPGLGDVNGDGKPDLYCCSEGYIGYAEADWKNPAAPWKFRAVSPKGDFQRFTHGIGIGDVNGDGRMDILEKDGWWEQPKKIKDGEVWIKHAEKFGKGGAQMFAYDVNGDGLNDVITAIEAHGHGISWFEQVKDNQGSVTFREHVIIGKDGKANPHGVVFTQPHAMELADLDGDGLKDLVTGKRFWAHGAHGDPNPDDPAVLYWFQLKRGGPDGAEFLPHLVDDDSGVGTQVTIAHVSHKKQPDILVGNKKGMFLFRHETKRANAP